MRSFAYTLLLTTTALAAQDWPTYRGDNARSGISESQLPPKLTEQWVWRSLFAPAPAWPGPAKRDAYNKVENMASRHAFDRAFHVVAAGGHLWFGSSADDQVRCLDATSGRELWSFFTEAPVRFAPTWHRGRLYVGSDDGFVYCLEGETGRLLWKQRPGPRDARVPGNGRMMSVWPIRSGVVVHGRTAYCTAGLFASEGGFLCALDAARGRTVWKHERKDLHPQGYMLASASNLYVTTGRGNPAVFERKSGKKIKSLGGQGGSFALLAGDAMIYGPGKTGQLGEFAAKSRDHIATFQGTRMLVRRGVAFLQTTTRLSCLDRERYLSLLAKRRKLTGQRDGIKKQLGKLRKQKKPDLRKIATLDAKLAVVGQESRKIDTALPGCFRWHQPAGPSFDLVLAGESLVTGGAGRVVVRSAATGRETQRLAVDGNARGLAVAHGRLYVSTDKGAIHCFAGGSR